MDIVSVPITLFIINSYNRKPEEPIPVREPIPGYIRKITSCFKLLSCQNTGTCCKSRKIINVVSVDEKLNTNRESEEFASLEWTDISRIWDVFFLKFYLMSVFIVTLAVIGIFLFEYYA